VGVHVEGRNVIMSSAKVGVAALVVAAVLGSSPEPARAGRLLGFSRNVVVVAPYGYGVPGYYASPYYGAPAYYPPYLPYEPGAYFRPRPFVYGGPEYLPGANWRDNWYDATRTKVHGYTLR
jgi:hypothetical protein